MKKFLGLGLIFLLYTGCSTHSGYIGHSINTNVELSRNNFKVIGSVTGEARASYIFGFGPTEQSLLGKAQRIMFNQVDLRGHSRAVINVTTDIKTSKFLSRFIWHEKIVYVSGDVIEFIDPSEGIKNNDN